MAHICMGKDTNIWSGFHDSYCSNLQLVLCKRLTLSAALIVVTEGYFKKIIKIGFPELEKQFLKRFRSFFLKMIALVSKLYNSESSSWLVLNFPVFMFVYIYPPTRITNLVRNVLDEKIYWYGTVSFVCFCFYQLDLCSVSYTANEYSIYHFCMMIKGFPISFSRVIIVLRLWNCVICIQVNLLCYFQLNDEVACFKSVQ